ncbi:MAG: HD domain-containing protein [Oligoflexia bacterium]|nr:HD domain-containing protein [Oligoflexia bacterium]
MPDSLDPQATPALGAAGAADSSLQAAQDSLGHALERARSGEDRELAALVRDEGQQLVRLLFGLLRMTRVHAINNEAFEKPLGELRETMNLLVETLGVIHCIAVEDQIYVNDVRIRFQDRGEGGTDLGMEFRRLGIGGMSFHAVPELDHLRVLVRGFAKPPVGAVSREALRLQLLSKGSDTIELHGLFRFRVSGEEEDIEEQDARVVARRATSVVDETWDNLVGNRVPNPLPLRRAITEILHMGAGLDGLWDDPRGASAFGGHTLRVARYSLFLASGCGLSDEAVQDLGLAAMFHDIGYSAREGASAPSDTDPGQPGFAPPFERHAGAGARILLRQRGFHEAKIRRALAALEHHRDFNDPKGRPSLFARIIRICEDYDNLVRRKGGRYAPPDAIAHMVQGAGTRYDPVLMQVFVNVMGKWPPGSLLELNDGRIVRSISTARDIRRWASPLARVEVDEDQQHYRQNFPIIDLATQGKVIRQLGHR